MIINVPTPLDDLAIDGCITKAPGGEVAGRSPVALGKQGMKRSLIRQAWTLYRWNTRPTRRP